MIKHKNKEIINISSTFKSFFLIAIFLFQFIFYGCDNQKRTSEGSDLFVENHNMTENMVPNTENVDSNISDGLIQISVSVKDSEAYEDGEDPGTFIIKLSSAAKKDIFLNFGLTGGAVLGEDYHLFMNNKEIMAPMIIPAGTSEITLMVVPKFSSRVETEERVVLSLKSGPDYTVDKNSSSAIISIFDYGLSPGKTYYVAVDGDDSADGSEAHPFATIKKGTSVLKAGDTLYIKDGTYFNSGFTSDHGVDGTQFIANNAVAPINVSGTKGNWIRILAYPDGNELRPHLKFDGSGGIWINKNVNYIVIEGLEISGPNKSIEYDWAHAHRWSKDNFYNGRGIFSWGPAHHIVIRDCYVHHTPGSGIRFDKSDYVLVENNTISNTSWWSSSGESGLVVAKAESIDEVEEVKILYSGNIAYNNWNLLEFCSLVYKDSSSTADDYGNCDHFSEGIKDGRGVYATRNNDTYFHGRIRFENNIAFNNGTEGVLFHKSHRGELVNNLVFMNGAYPGFNLSTGLAVMDDVDDVIVHNNLTWARKNNDYGILKWREVTNFSSIHNVVIGKIMLGNESENTVIKWDQAPDLKKLWKNVVDISTIMPDPHGTGVGYAPANIDLEISALHLDFHTLPSADLLISKGTNEMAPSSDIDLIDRPQGTAVDIGAYEFKK